MKVVTVRDFRDRASEMLADGQSMTVADVVAQVQDGRLEDFVGEAVVLVARGLMEAEVTAEIGAELGEIAPETRITHPQRVPPKRMGDEGRARSRC